MTEARYGDVDFDRLADFIGGALDGTADQRAVSELIATDARWAAAYSALLEADSAVRADLALLAAVPEPMPDDVTVRIAAAIDSDGTGRRLGLVRDNDEPAGNRTPARLDRRRRTRRWTAAVAVAAAVVVGVFGTVTVLSNLPGAGNKNSATSAEAPQSRNGQGGSQLAGPPDVTAPQLLASGTNYNPGAFGKLSSGDTAIAPLAPGGSSRSANEAVPGPGGGPAISGPIPNELRRLTGATGRDACLAAILAEYGGTVTLVDYARFEGRPALVVLLDGAKGRSTPWVVVVGPSCGTGGAIADELFNGPAR